MTRLIRNPLCFAVVAAALSLASMATAQPQAVETRIGTLEFHHGLPTKATVEKLYDELDFQRACQAYMWGLPLVGMAEWQQAHYQTFGAGDGDIVIYNNYRDKLDILTANATTPYLISFVHLARTGPVVIDLPAGPNASSVLDFWQRSITDMGQTGPDQGAGGKYLERDGHQDPRCGPGLSRSISRQARPGV